MSHNYKPQNRFASRFKSVPLRKFSVGSFSPMRPEAESPHQQPSCCESSVDITPHSKDNTSQGAPSSSVNPSKAPLLSAIKRQRGLILRSVLHYRLPLNSTLRRSWSSLAERLESQVSIHSDFQLFIVVLVCMIFRLYVAVLDSSSSVFLLRWNVN